MIQRLILTTRALPTVGVLVTLDRPDPEAPGVVRYRGELYVLDPDTSALSLGPPPNVARYFRCEDVVTATGLRAQWFASAKERRALGFQEDDEP